MLTSLTLQSRALAAGLRRLAHVLAAAVGSSFVTIRFALDPCRLPVPVPIPVRRPRPSARSLFPILALGVLLGGAPAAEARHPFDYTADGRLVDVEVIVDGSAAPLFFRPGVSDRLYFQAFRGRNYSLAVTNNTGERVGVVIAVDGLNVVNGERTSLAGTEPMYVLGPYDRAVIRGWRTSLREVRRFVFVDEERSYAERTGQANGDMGWIRVHSFREERPRVWVDPRFRPGDERDGEPFGSREPRSEGEGEVQRAPEAPRPDAAWNREPSAKRGAETLHGAPAPQSNPGTGWGDARRDPVERTVFNAVRHATDRIVLRYEYESGLRALGIFPRRTPRTWMRERGELGWGFAQPPPGW